jgi:Outer membrane protein beta-barrel domain
MQTLKLSLAVFIIWFIAVAPAFAQARSADNQWGLAIGGTASTYAGIQPSNLSPNFSVGIYGSFRINDRFSIDPKIFFKYNGGASGLTLPPPPQGSTTIFDSTDVKRTANYISIMAPVSYHFSKALSVSFGPQFMILTNGSDRYKTTSGGDVLTTDSKDVMHKYDAGITTGLSYQNKITIGLMYYYGLMYAIKQNDSPAKNSIIQLWVGVPISKKSPTEN